MGYVTLEYIWLDGYDQPNLRSKTKVIKTDQDVKADSLAPPDWNFDGSSTKQAEGRFSDCILKPVRVVRDPLRWISDSQSFLVLCDVYERDGVAHPSNTRFRSRYVPKEYWFGFEQEYCLVNPKTKKPIGFPKHGVPEPQGKYYCGVGHHAVKERQLVEAHLAACLNAGLQITGINAEVMLGQWEFQLLGKGVQAADDLWLARYILERLAEESGILIELHPKPIEGDWNGSGLHTNFSNDQMRDYGGKALFDDILQKLEKNHDAHIDEYGSFNEKRLTGAHETSPITEFSWGLSDRGCSVRIPISTAETWKGYLEDRRPASNADPYRVIWSLYNTISSFS